MSAAVWSHLFDVLAVLGGNFMFEMLARIGLSIGLMKELQHNQPVFLFLGRIHRDNAGILSQF